MAYMNKNAELKNGYNAYIDSSVDDMGTQMDVGLLLMEAGDTYVYEDAKKEVAILLFSGSVTYEWDGMFGLSSPRSFVGEGIPSDRLSGLHSLKLP